MDDKKTYRCKECNQTVVVDGKGEAPICCKAPMALELTQCRGVHAEMARSTDDDEPCDDGRGQGL